MIVSWSQSELLRCDESNASIRMKSIKKKKKRRYYAADRRVFTVGERAA